MRASVKHLLGVVITFSLAAIPTEGFRQSVAQGYAQSSNALYFDHTSVGKGGTLSLQADTTKHEGTMSQDAALILGTARKPRIVVFGVNLRRDVYLPFMLALLTALCAPTTWKRRLGAGAIAASTLFVLSLLSFRAIAAWYFLVHGAQWMVYAPDPGTTKVAKVLYKALLSQPNYRLALAAGVGALSLWLFGYAPLRGQDLASAPLGRLLARLRPSAKPS